VRAVLRHVEAVIRIQDLPPGTASSVVRFYEDPNAGAYGPYQVVCTANWEPPDAVWIHGLMGTTKGGWTLWREFITELSARGVTTIKATRAEGRRLPRAVRMPAGHYEMQVADLMLKPVDSGFIPL
jgi:hypothetical protein